MVSWSFLLASSSPPNVDGPSSAAIWANCWIGNDSGNLPTSPNFSASSTLLSNSLSVGAVSTSGTGWSASARGSGWGCTSTVVLTWRALLPSPILSVFLILAMLEFERKSANEKPEQLPQEPHDIHCELTSVIVSMAYWVAVVLFHEKNMSKEWGKYKRILDREDKEYRRAMEEEVSTFISSKFRNKYRILAGVDIIAQSQIDLPIFKQCLTLMP